jgi:ABC-type Fe3+-hydroxamate transport system substrate-binding protein
MNKEKEREIAIKEMDEFLAKLRKKYGQSKSIIS